MIKISRARVAALALLAGGAALIPSLTASAHVTVSSPDASAGGFGKLVFRVPSESDTANTTSVTVELPTDTPFRFVSVRQIPGWTAEPITSQLPEPVEGDGFTLTEAVTSVTWTAEGDGLGPHQFTEFELSVGPFPDGTDTLVFPATQTYSDGEVVEWADVAEGDAEPERPAPVLELGGGGDDAAADSDDGDSTDNVTRVLAIVGVALGAAALAVAVSGRRAQRSGSA